MGRADKFGVPKVKHYSLQEPKINLNLEGESYLTSTTRSLMAQVVNHEDEVLCEAIIRYAVERGYTDLFLVDEEFVKAAIENEARRRRGEGCYQKECPFCHAELRATKGSNIICSCNAKYYYWDGMWLDRNTGRRVCEVSGGWITADLVVNQAKAEAYEEFAARLKRCILERDDETIDCVKENLLGELKRKGGENRA